MGFLNRNTKVSLRKIKKEVKNQKNGKTHYLNELILKQSTSIVRRKNPIIEEKNESSKTKWLLKNQERKIKITGTIDWEHFRNKG